MDQLVYKGYTGTVEYSKADNCLFGKVEGLRGNLISYEGISIDELITDFQNAVDTYLTMCEVTEKKPAKPFKGSFNVRVSPELHQQVAFVAKKNGETLNSFVKKAIERELKMENTD